MSKYLYGASIQGIQSFIFQTNELKDVIGASALIDYICKDYFINNFLGNGEPIINAAGNIKCIYSNIDECKNTVRLLPKVITEMAPGITISQAVVKIEEENKFADYTNELEKRLRTQRNKPSRSSTTSFMAVERSRKTGLPATTINKDGDFIDINTEAKRNNSSKLQLELCRKCFGMKELRHTDVAYNLEDITDRNNWIAIIHADGNGLGQIVAKIGHNEEKLKDFSVLLDKATTSAAQKAFTEIMWQGNIIPIRPIVLGGDDLTIICRADIALNYASSFLYHFEEETKATGYALTACAGISFIKSSYPFHYGYKLAEALCERAKKDCKQISDTAPSCLMFHKVQSSFVERYDDIAAKELIPQEDLSFEFGPYYLHEQKDRWTISKLKETAMKLNGKEGNVIKTDIRQWCALLNQSEGLAEQKTWRIENIDKPKDKSTYITATSFVKRGEKRHSPAYDILSIITVENQNTKK